MGQSTFMVIFWFLASFLQIFCELLIERFLIIRGYNLNKKPFHLHKNCFSAGVFCLPLRKGNNTQGEIKEYILQEVGVQSCLLQK